MAGARVGDELGILKRFPDGEVARAYARRLVGSADQVGWRVVWQPTGLHIVKVEEHPSGIGIVFYRNGDADVYQGRFPIPWPQ